MNIKSIAAALVSMTIFLIPVEVQAQRNSNSESMRYLLGRAARDLPNHYMSGSSEGYLSVRESKSYNLNLTPGREYTFMAACDSDCSDIDLAVLYNGEKIMERTEIDDFPTQILTPLGPGYGIQITMHSCRTNVCGFAFGVFRR